MDLSRIAQGVFIGNGEVWNFLDYAVNRNCGGLLSYTQKNNFLKNNLINNFDGGQKAKYTYGDITSVTFEKDNKGDIINIIGKGVDIGASYKIGGDRKNSELKFKDENTLLNIAKDYRDRIKYEISPFNVYENVEREKYSDLFDGDTITDIPFGGLYKVENEIKNETAEHNIVGIGGNQKLKYGIDNKEGVFYETPKTINDIKKKRTALKRSFSRTANDAPPHNFKDENGLPINEDIILYKKDELYGKISTWNNNYFNCEKVDYDKQRYSVDAVCPDKVIKYYDDIKPSTKFGRLVSGVTDFYVTKREDSTVKLISSSKNILFPKHLGIETHWNKETPYGIIQETGREDFYAVGQKGIESETKIDTKFTDSGFIEKGKNYYYEEGGLGGDDVMNFENTSRLLQYTNKLFRESKVGSLVKRFHTPKSDFHSDVITSYDSVNGISRGRNLLRQDGKSKDIDGYDNPYCRTWTAHYQYSKLNHLIKPFKNEEGKVLGIDEVQGHYDFLRPLGSSYLSSNTVLDKNGFVRITPTHSGSMYVNMKKYMFSIENLAWKGNTSSLSKEQLGPNGGRIMWFPPYNLKFSENINTSWNPNTFIGRGEELYTYTHTKRSGTLDFVILIDHPSILNKWRGTSSESIDKEKNEQELLRFFAGEGILDKELFPQSQPYNGEEERERRQPKTYNSIEYLFLVYFPPFFSGADYIKENKYDELIELLRKYNSGEDVEYVQDKGLKKTFEKYYSNLPIEKLSINKEDIINYAKETLGEDLCRNRNIYTFSDLLNIKEKIDKDNIFGAPKTESELTLISYRGGATDNALFDINNIKRLSENRGVSLYKILRHLSEEVKNTKCLVKPVDGKISDDASIEIGVPDINSETAQLGRFSYISLKVKYKDGMKPSLEENEVRRMDNNIVKQEKDNENMVTINLKSEQDDKIYYYDNEYLYFSHIKNDNLINKYIVDKVRYFDPAFHSITPEGFNARLTFLQQCTRQGPTNSVGTANSNSNDYLKYAGILAFGRPPFCVLRIGDFFHTKICIDSMSIQYDNNGVQWDLNPEGIGVQPMYATVSINFTFLGGQSLNGPIERLQNAVTSNFYANTCVYSRHSDTPYNYFDATKDTQTILNN